MSVQIKFLLQQTLFCFYFLNYLLVLSNLHQSIQSLACQLFDLKVLLLLNTQLDHLLQQLIVEWPSESGRLPNIFKLGRIATQQRFHQLLLVQCRLSHDLTIKECEFLCLTSGKLLILPPEVWPVGDVVHAIVTRLHPVECHVSQSSTQDINAGLLKVLDQRGDTYRLMCPKFESNFFSCPPISTSYAQPAYYFT